GEDKPEAGVVLADKAGGSSNRHILDECHDERFEQKRETGSRPCPGHVDEAHATVGTVDAGDARVQEGLVLKEIEVAPGLLHRVVHRAVGLAALGTGKPATGLEVDLDIEPLLVDVELAVHHHPRRHQAECELEQIDIAHGLSSCPVAPIVPPCLRPSRTSLTVALRTILDRPCARRRSDRAAGTGGCSAGPNQRMGPRKPYLAVPITHSCQRGGSLPHPRTEYGS